MQRFQYQYGDRPLEGYTIQRGVGRGGFGEVYYAISDSGKQVALKTLQTYEQIELRGINQCMNLKSPHLVTIFDVKYNTQGRPFVIMEYVSGPSLADLIQESPGGLGTQKAAFFLREIAKGLNYLHECGIVHRDLKPSNIFYEDGSIKIGDYGLSKAMNTSRHSGQTITVGTVHYMAPEIGAGCYNRSIDIYALGIVLYEMLTGQVPFFGNSPAEVLMKHMSSEPDLTGMDETFARVIRRALAKDPENRYQSVQEMVEDVFGSDHIRNSVSQFSPQSLSVAAEKIAGKNKPQARPTPGHADTPPPIPQPKPAAASHENRSETKPYPQVLLDAAATDPVNKNQRIILAGIAAAAIAIGIGLMSNIHGMIIPEAFITTAMIFVAGKIIIISRWKWLAGLEDDSVWLRRFALGAITAIPLGAMAAISSRGLRSLGPGTWLTIALAVCLVDWWKVSTPERKKRVDLGHALWAGLLAYLLALVLHGSAAFSAGVLAGASLVVQILTPFSMSRSAIHAYHEKQKKPEPGPQSQASTPPLPPIPQNAGQAVRQQPPAIPLTAPGVMKSVPRRHSVPGAIRFLWLIVFIALLGVGIGTIVFSVEERDEAFLALGIAFLWLGLMAFLRIFQGRFRSWYGYLIQPFLSTVCVLTIIGSCILLSEREIPEAIGIPLIVIGGLCFVASFIALGIFRGRQERKQVYQQPQPPKPVSTNTGPVPGVSPYKRIWALIMCGGFFVSLPGLHRFYVGKIGTGLLWFFTGGCFVIGQVIDAIMILTGQFTDAQGRVLLMWENEAELTGKEMPDNVKQAAIVREQAKRQQAAQQQQVQPDRREETVQKPSYYPPVSAPRMRPVVPYHSFNPITWICAFLGHIILLVALVVGLATAVHVPDIIAAGFPDPHLSEEIGKALNTQNWPAMLAQIGPILTVLLFLLAATLLIIGRRNGGAMYILRALMGIFGLLAVQSVLTSAFAHTSGAMLANAFQQHNFEQAWNTMLSTVQATPLYTAAGVFILSVFILAWPPRKQKAITSAI
ncbi:MAG: protein kinase [Sedimentisphaerales bacterium]|nr:protein kinase [Sedimentisphaerales bacterium]